MRGCFSSCPSALSVGGSVRLNEFPPQRNFSHVLSVSLYRDSTVCCTLSGAPFFQCCSQNQGSPALSTCAIQEWCSCFSKWQSELRVVLNSLAVPSIWAMMAALPSGDKVWKCADCHKPCCESPPPPPHCVAPSWCVQCAAASTATCCTAFFVHKYGGADASALWPKFM